MRSGISKILFCAVLITLAASGLSAAVIPCPASTNLAALEAFDTVANACFSQDKLFYNFTYSGLGPAAPAAGDVTTSLIFQAGAGVDIHGWNFGSNWSQSGANLASFTLGYTIQVCNDPACIANVIPGTAIIAADAAYAPSAVTGAGPETITWSNGATTTLTNANSGPLPTGGNIGYNNVGPIAVSAAFSGTGTITQTTLRFYEATPIVVGTPEPATLSMILGGAGLLAIGGFHRRRRRP
jgi:hypothetical protein